MILTAKVPWGRDRLPVHWLTTRLTAAFHLLCFPLVYTAPVPVYSLVKIPTFPRNFLVIRKRIAARGTFRTRQALVENRAEKITRLRREWSMFARASTTVDIRDDRYHYLEAKAEDGFALGRFVDPRRQPESASERGTKSRRARASSRDAGRASEKRDVNAYGGRTVCHCQGPIGRAASRRLRAERCWLDDDRSCAERRGLSEAGRRGEERDPRANQPLLHLFLS